MTISTRPLDKYAFLFAGENNDQYRADLRKVLETLIYWYGFIPEKVFVRVSFPVSSLTETVFTIPGLNLEEITGVDVNGLQSSLEAEIHSFIDEAKILDADISPGELNTAFFYFTGPGRINPVNSKYELQIGTVDSTSVYINPLWLKNSIYDYDNQALRDSSFIHIFMQQSYGFGFWDVFNQLTDSDLRMTFTAACDSGAVNPVLSAGSQFTDYWTRALQFEQRDTTGNGDMIYADQEDTGGLEPTTNHLISLYKAYLFAKSFTASITAPQYKLKMPAGDPADQYLGLPSFWIRDGDEPIPPETPDYWWESKDIFLTHPEATDPDARDDIYHANKQNNIHIVIRNNGTHPVREFWSGTLVFLSGGGGTGDSVVNIHDIILKPGEAYEHIYPYDFTGTQIHRCVRSRASLDEITLEQLDQDGVDDIQWLIVDRSCEAQRNLDQQSDTGKGGTGTGNMVPEPGEGKADEANPEEEAKPPVDENGNEVQPEGTTESKSTSNLRNFREHTIIIRNVFRRKRKFIIAPPDEFEKLFRYCRIEICEKNNKNGRYRILKPDGKKDCVLEFDLKAGETKELIIYTSLKPTKLFNHALKLPFEIYIETASVRKRIEKILKRTVDEKEIPDFMSFSGFTVELCRAKGATLHGTVFNAKRKPLPGAFVYIWSGDRNQSAIVRTNKFGTYCVKDINPDNYIIQARTKDFVSKEKIIHLGDGKSAGVDFFVPAEKESVKRVRRKH
ncbi:MAG: carboxypeptidase-like regulatory domain-containing protein [Bacteroidales bacterium]